MCMATRVCPGLQRHPQAEHSAWQLPSNKGSRSLNLRCHTSMSCLLLMSSAVFQWLIAIESSKLHSQVPGMYSWSPCNGFWASNALCVLPVMGQNVYSPVGTLLSVGCWHDTWTICLAFRSPVCHSTI